MGIDGNSSDISHIHNTETRVTLSRLQDVSNKLKIHPGVIRRKFVTVAPPNLAQHAYKHKHKHIENEKQVVIQIAVEMDVPTRRLVRQQRQQLVKRRNVVIDCPSCSKFFRDFFTLIKKRGQRPRFDYCSCGYFLNCILMVFSVLSP